MKKAVAMKRETVWEFTMLSLGLAALAILSLLWGTHAKADIVTAPAGTVSKADVKAKKKLSTDVSFSGASVEGRYHSAGDGLAQIDDEKNLNSLIGMRKNFRDRLSAERAQVASDNAVKGTSK